MEYYKNWVFGYIGDEDDNMNMRDALELIYRSRKHHQELMHFPWCNDYCNPPRFMLGKTGVEKTPTDHVSTLAVLEIYTATTALACIFFETSKKKIVDEEHLKFYTERFDACYNTLCQQRSLYEWKYHNILKSLQKQEEDLEWVNECRFIVAQNTLSMWIIESELFYHKINALCQIMDHRAETDTAHLEEHLYTIDALKATGYTSPFYKILKVRPFQPLTLNFSLVPHRLLSEEEITELTRMAEMTAKFVSECNEHLRKVESRDEMPKLDSVSFYKDEESSMPTLERADLSPVTDTTEIVRPTSRDRSETVVADVD